MKNDLQIKADVTAELVWDPAVNATHVGVAVKNGIVTLSGEVDTYLQKHAVERAVRRVSGVRGIAVDLEVRLAPDHHRSDADIAQAALHALRWHSLVPDDKVKVEVEDGWVTLTGEVDWAYQAASAEQCLHPLVGVRGVTNKMEVWATPVEPERVKFLIEDVLERRADREANRIRVSVDEGDVTLTGAVKSWDEKKSILAAVGHAPGVKMIHDHLFIDPYDAYFASA